mmetsp:Transcript_22215/g.87520  ORF Transcript_22215/g.87520 Transcript_22215/m.87520 type:complete len:218 (-) Transcript_22215:1247-1900(-)
MLSAASTAWRLLKLPSSRSKQATSTSFSKTAARSRIRSGQMIIDAAQCATLFSRLIIAITFGAWCRVFSLLHASFNSSDGVMAAKRRKSTRVSMRAMEWESTAVKERLGSRRRTAEESFLSCCSKTSPRLVALCASTHAPSASAASAASVFAPASASARAERTIAGVKSSGWRRIQSATKASTPRWMRARVPEERREGTWKSSWSFSTSTAPEQREG